jgi:hypothetical protein
MLIVAPRKSLKSLIRWEKGSGIRHRLPGLKSLGNGRILEKQTEFVLNLS